MLKDQRRGLGRQRCPSGRKDIGKFKAIGNVVKVPKLNTAIEKRLEESAVAIMNGDSDGTGYIHSVLCQTSLPYRDPGDDVREYERTQGAASLIVSAGHARDPETGKVIKLGLPYGPKARLLLCFINTQAKLKKSPEIELGDSLTSFVRDELKLAPHGRNMNLIKDQMARLAASHLYVGYSDGARSYNAQGNIIREFDLWFPKDDRQRVLWPSFVRMSNDYFDSLMEHAVPLEMHALASLSHSAMALDVYAWLAQRLHRLPRGRRNMIPWTALKEQFGPDYARINKFREVFMIALKQACVVYRAARIDVTKHGLFLYQSPPPIEKTGRVISLPLGDKTAP